MIRTDRRPVDAAREHRRGGHEHEEEPGSRKEGAAGQIKDCTSSSTSQPARIRNRLTENPQASQIYESLGRERSRADRALTWRVAEVPASAVRSDPNATRSSAPC